jgi:hypothetical protein
MPVGNASNRARPPSPTQRDGKRTIKNGPIQAKRWRAKARDRLAAHIASNATGVDLFREVNGSGTWTEIQSGVSSAMTSYTDTAASNGNTYIYLLSPHATGAINRPYCRKANVDAR